MNLTLQFFTLIHWMHFFYCIFCESIYFYYLMCCRLHKAFYYFMETWLLIHKTPPGGFDAKARRQKRIRKCAVHLCFIAMQIRCWITLAQMLPGLSKHWRIIIWDQMDLFEGKPEWNWVFWCIGFLCSFN